MMRLLLCATCCVVLRAQPESDCQAEKAQVSAIVAERDLARTEAANAKQELEALKVAKQQEVSKFQEELSAAKVASTELEAGVKHAANQFATLQERFTAATAKAEAEANKLEEELRVAKASAADVDVSISISRDLVTLASMSSDAIEHLLEQIDLDERFVAEVSKQMQTAKSFTSQYSGLLSSIDYQGKAQDVVGQLTSHPVYLAHVAPHVDMLLAHARPHLEMVSKQAAPHLDTARAQYVVASAAVQGAIPALQQLGEQASKVSEHLEVPKRKAEELLGSIFNAVAKAAPNHSKALPAGFVDRMLLLVVSVVLAFNFLFFFRRLYKIALRVALFVVRWALKICVVFPLTLLRRILALGLCLSTGCYCCGMCRKKKAKVQKLAATNAAKNDAPVATVAELTQMLEVAKKKGKLDAGVAQLVTQAQKGKTVTIPKTNEAKVVSVDALKKALASFKEVNVKKLGL